MNNKTSAKSNLARFGLAFLLLTFITFGIRYGVQIILGGLNSDILDSHMLTLVLSTAPLYLVALPVCLLFVRPVKSDGENCQNLSFGYFLVAIIAVFGVTSAGNLIGTLLMGLFSFFTKTEVVNPVVELAAQANPLAFFIATVIIAPLGEEFIFRRLIIDNTSRYGEKFALFLSAAMFGAFHTNVYQIPYAFLFGLVVGFIYIKTRRLRYTIALHAILNFTSGVLPSLLIAKLIPMLESIESAGTISAEDSIFLMIVLLIEFLYIGFLFTCTVTTIVLAFVYKRKLIFEKSDEKANVFKSPFILLFFIACLILTILRIILG